ncbi:helix-turn-helix domain-containing protein [Roseivirga sp.]|uniref:helix-turn-helix domain-containing protein n=1 Tax=Roseivirga sp. TaxID=1964215 RepID=UPI002B26BCEB|nr:helix-turn-helix domain-containing protein [Roseivirga sp.]
MKNIEQAQKIKQIRNRKGMSQEGLAQASQLSLRTIQRIENGETTPHGDSLQKLALALEVSPDELIDWQIQEDKSKVSMLLLSQFSFLAFPVLGIIIPLVIWILNRHKIKGLDSVGKATLNFQITWSLLLFGLNLLALITTLLLFKTFSNALTASAIITSVLYLLNLVMVIKNLVSYSKQEKVTYWPTLHLLK